MKALARNGQEIKVGHVYRFANIPNDADYRITEIIDADCVRVDDGWNSTRWACNALYEITNK